MNDANESAGRGEVVRALVVLLVLAGAAVGVLLSMEVKGRERRAGLVGENHELRSQLAFVEARYGEVVSFLGRPQTELVKLTGVREWTGQAVSVAWNPVQRTAMVLLDRLPKADGAYQLRAVSERGALKLGEIDVTGAAKRVYSVPTSVGERVEFDVVVGEGERVVFGMVKT